MARYRNINPYSPGAPVFAPVSAALPAGESPLPGVKYFIGKPSGAWSLSFPAATAADLGKWCYVSWINGETIYAPSVDETNTTVFDWTVGTNSVSTLVAECTALSESGYGLKLYYDESEV